MKHIVALISSFALCACLSCGRDANRCTEPESDNPPMAYFFREAVPACTGCDLCYYAYWYFECVDEACRYVGYWDPLDQPDPPPWLVSATAAEECYDDWSWGCQDTIWGFSSDPRMTPRDNEEAEEAAIWLSGSLVAPQDLYDRIAHDLALVRSAYGDDIHQLREIRFTPYLRSSAIWVNLMPEAAYRYTQGEFHDLDSLNTLFKVRDILAYHDANNLSLLFEGRYDTIQLAQIYGDTPSVIAADPGVANGGFCRLSTVLPWPVK